MRLGIVTDVHNHAAELAAALAAFRLRGVDRVVTIGDTGDVFGRGGGLADVTRLLDEAGVTGVWGNHDFSLCRDVPDDLRERYPAEALAVMARMEPRLVIGDCHFSHKEANIDPHDVEQLWELSERPLDLTGKATTAFAAHPARLHFVGHYHQWWAGTPAATGWAGEGVLKLSPGERYWVVVAAVCEGWCALLDTDCGELEPIRCGVPHS